MPYYRLYFLEQNHIRHVVAFECDTDAEAFGRARLQGDGRAMEIWEGARLVRRFEAEDHRLNSVAG